VKLIIQIPCFNEEETLAETVLDLPLEMEGFESVELLVIDDGSTDRTSEVARELGVDHLIRFPRNRGLAATFAAGLEASLEYGADVIVNTDGDHQYQGESIRSLVGPILDGTADMVVGDRRVETIRDFSRTKKLLQKLGSRVVRWTSGTSVPDATSGFRALTREAALQLVVFSSYTYTLETIIQAGKKGLTVTSVPVGVNKMLRESRLVGSIPGYVARSAVTIVRIFLMYEALRVFLSLGVVPLIGGGVLVLRFAYFSLIGQGGGHVQSLIAAAVLIVLGLLTFLLGMLADLIARNRRLSEEISYRLRRIDLESSPQGIQGIGTKTNLQSHNRTGT